VQRARRQPDVDPAGLGDEVVTLRVTFPLLGVKPMVGALEVGADEVFLPTHVDASADVALGVVHRYSSLW